MCGSFVRLDDTEFYTLVVRDVTARKEMDRLRNEFVATVSHELRTPLAAVMGFLETVLSQRSGPLNDVQNRHLGLSYKAAQRLNRHVEELLTVSKIQQGQLRLNRKDFDPALAVENAVNVVSPLALARSIDLQTFLDHEGCETVVGDRERLEQVLINLASNAIKFTPEHGRVSIHSRVESGRWHFSIEDNGIGIASDEVEQAFRRFHRGKNVEDEQVQGAGLGLYICRIIVEAHGGTISLSSVFGEGTTVSVMVSDTGEGTVLDPARMLHSV
jgi:two-component system sensor histidine kinase VicK